MSRGAKRLAYDQWVASQPKPKPVARTLIPRERGTAQSFAEVMAEATGGAENGHAAPTDGEEDTEPSEAQQRADRWRNRTSMADPGLLPETAVAIILVGGRVERATLVGFSAEAVAFRRSARRATIWLPWRRIRSLRAGEDGPRHRSRPHQTRAIWDYVASRGGRVPAGEVTAALWSAYQWNRNSLTPARRRAGIIAEYDTQAAAWYWRLPTDGERQHPEEEDHD